MRIREKNVRISKIISQLKLDDPLVQPSFNISEEPEKVLTVEDSEMTIEKYVSPEERQRLEEEAKLEEERRLAAMGDNPRERALDMMMGGRLEANVEEDLFKVGGLKFLDRVLIIFKRIVTQITLSISLLSLCSNFPILSYFSRSHN